MVDQAILQLRNVTHSYVSTPVLKGIDFTLRAGEIHSICGENGAGKSTLVKIIAGMIQPTDGEVLVDGKPARVTPDNRLSYGISIVPQHLDLFSGLTVAENLYITELPKTRFGLIDRKKLYRQTREWLERFALNIAPETIVEDLSFVQQKLLLILKALKNESRIVILDEPTASLNQDDITKLFDNIRLFNERGVAFIYISHHLEEIFDLCSTVTTLRDGKVVRNCPVADIDLRQLITDMVGNVAPTAPRQPVDRDAEPAIRIDHLSGPTVLKDMSLEVRPGQILGIVGHRSSGKDEFVDVLFGLRYGGRKSIQLDGKEIALRSPAEGLAHGISILPGDRHRDGLFLDQSIANNMTASSLADITTRMGFLDAATENNLAQQFVKKLSLRCASTDQEVQFLSGGNQQKVVFSKQILAKPQVLVLDSPTVGVDIKSRSEIHNAIQELALGGTAILLVSSDVDEVLALCDRVSVLFKGAVTHVLSAQDPDFNRTTIGYLMEGGRPQ